MRITLNGEPRDLQHETSVKSLLELLGLDGRLVAVELNRIVVKRDRYSATVIPDNAEIEIVSFVGWG
jgi:sulfur carrier protein